MGIRVEYCVDSDKAKSWEVDNCCNWSLIPDEGHLLETLMFFEISYHSYQPFNFFTWCMGSLPSVWVLLTTCPVHNNKLTIHIRMPSSLAQPTFNKLCLTLLHCFFLTTPKYWPALPTLEKACVPPCLKLIIVNTQQAAVPRWWLLNDPEQFFWMHVVTQVSLTWWKCPWLGRNALLYT